MNLTPQEIVNELNKFIVGQEQAKRAVAIAIRNRWRRQQLPEDIQKEITPKNILMIGPTGVGKTEIARRLAQLLGAPFIKVEATKYTEVGYHGRDVESMVRDLVEASVAIIRENHHKSLETKAREKTSQKLLELLLPDSKGSPWSDEDMTTEEDQERLKRTRKKLLVKLEAGELEDRKVEMSVESKQVPMAMFSNMGWESMDPEMQAMFEKLIPKQSSTREFTVREARKILMEKETEGMIDRNKLSEEAIALAENQGIIFIDELDKVCGNDDGRGPDVSRQGVQRDLLPVVEGTTINTKYGSIKTDHILFIAAGAFHFAKPSDLMPELQGRFPIRVELTDLNREDFLRILTEPQNALTKQYIDLLSAEGVDLKFTKDGIEALAEMAYQVNQIAQNIGARRLHTILERVVEEISFAAPHVSKKKSTIDAKYVREKLESIVQHEDMSKFIL